MNSSGGEAEFSRSRAGCAPSLRSLSFSLTRSLPLSFSLLIPFPTRPERQSRLCPPAPSSAQHTHPPPPSIRPSPSTFSPHPHTPPYSVRLPPLSPAGHARPPPHCVFLLSVDPPPAPPKISDSCFGEADASRFVQQLILHGLWVGVRVSWGL